MGKLSRTKGRAFEQQIARDLRARFPAATIHRSSQADRAYESDVVITDGPPLLRRLWLECQDSSTPTPLDKLAQAERDIAEAAAPTFEPPRLAVVVWHKKATRAVHATMRNAAWMVFASDDVGHRYHPGVPITLDWEQLLSVLKETA